MERTWSKKVYATAGSLGALAVAVTFMFSSGSDWLHFVSWQSWDAFYAVCVFTGGVSTTIVLALVDFMVHAMWRRPDETEGDPWIEVEELTVRPRADHYRDYYQDVPRNADESDIAWNADESFKA